MEHFDVLIVGAGLSGIGAAHHLQTHCSEWSYAILEARSTMGGTWDLFRYPGIRSDSDMFTLGYSFKPWQSPKAIADGLSILKYIQDTAKEGDIDKNIKYQHRLLSANWSSKSKKWTLDIQINDSENKQMTCNFLLMCSGYYNYEKGHQPSFKGEEQFEGRIVHPQKWTTDIDYNNKKVVVIGSGATAVTLVPELAKKAAKVTMLQRSPTYIISGPSEDKIANSLRRTLPAKMAYRLTRWKNIFGSIFFFNLARRRPKLVKQHFLNQVKKELGPDYNVNKHFKPSYNPWDQRVCLVPDSDLFQSIKSGKSEVVTDHIEQFTPTGIQLKSGEHVDADLIVTATGIELQFMGNSTLYVDEKKVNPSELFNYKGMMFSNVPNFVLVFGYTNASWTLKSDLTCEYVCRLLKYIKKTGKQQCTPRMKDADMEQEPLLNFKSGYVLRSIDDLPKQGTKSPWKLHQNYALDIFNFRYSRLNDGVLEFE